MTSSRRLGIFSVLLLLLACSGLARAAETPASLLEPATLPPSRAELLQQFENWPAEEAMNGFFDYKFGSKLLLGPEFELIGEEKMPLGEMPELNDFTPAMRDQMLKSTGGVYVYDQSSGLHLPVRKYRQQIEYRVNDQVYAYYLNLSVNNQNEIVAYEAQRLPHGATGPLWKKLDALAGAGKLEQRGSTYTDPNSRTLLVVMADYLKCFRAQSPALISAARAAQGGHDQRAEQARQEAARARAEKEQREQEAKAAAEAAKSKYANSNYLQWLGAMSAAELRAVNPSFNPVEAKITVFGPDFTEYELSPQGTVVMGQPYLVFDSPSQVYIFKDKVAGLVINPSEERLEATLKSIRDNFAGQTRQLSVSKNLYEPEAGVYERTFQYTVTLGQSADRVYLMLQVKDVKNSLYVFDKAFYESLVRQGATEKAGQPESKSLL